MTISILRSTDHHRMQWANGGGWTSEIIAWPNRADWQWRLSVADVEVDGPFSIFFGIDRHIAMLVGDGFELAIGSEQTQTHRINQPFVPFKFRGDDRSFCRLIKGGVQDLNLMVRRDAPRFNNLQLAFVSLIEPVDLDDVEVVVVVSGQVKVEGVMLGRLDAIVPRDHPLNISTAGPEPAVIALVAKQHMGGLSPLLSMSYSVKSANDGNIWSHASPTSDVDGAIAGTVG